MDLAKAQSAQWFHSIDFRPRLDFISPSRFKDAPPNYTLFGFYDLLEHLDLRGASCLDIGTMDGIVSFILKKRGAARLVATDIASRDTFLFAKETLGIDIGYHPGTDLYNVTSRVAGERFDLVVMAGILYHVFDPLYAISTARHLTKLNGFAVIETHYLPKEERPVMLFNPADPDAIQSKNFFWRASMSCLEQMFILCCFHVVAKVSIGKRITYLLRADRPSAMKEANSLTQGIQASFMNFKHYRENIDFRALENEPEIGKVSLVRAPEPAKRIHVRKYTPSVPFQPVASAP